MAFVNTFRPTTQIQLQERADTGALATLDTRLVVVGAKTDSGSAATHELARIFAESQVDELFGVGSEISLLARAAFLGLQDAQGAGVQVFGLPLADAGGTARVLAFTCAGEATAGAELAIRLGPTEIVATIAQGDDSGAVATVLADAIGARREIPYTTQVTGSVCSVAAVNTGVNANDWGVSVLRVPPGVTVEAAETTAGAGATSIGDALLALEAADIQYLAVANHEAADISLLRAHVAKMWGPLKKRWRWAFVGATALAAADSLAAAADNRGVVVVAAQSSPNTPGQIAAYMAAQAASEPQPNRPFDSPMELPSLALTPTPLLDEEIETFGPRGVWLLDRNARGTRMRSIRGVTTQTTVDGVADASQLDITIGRSQVEFARQLDRAFARNFNRGLKTDRDKARVRDVAINVALALEARNILRDVLALKEQFRVTDTSEDPSLPTDTVRISVPASVIPPLRNKQVDMSLIVR